MDPTNPIFFDQKLGELWGVVALLSIASYFAMRWRTWLSGTIIIIGTLLSVMMLMEMSDPASAGGVALTEGSGYLAHTRFVSAALFLGPVIAAVLAGLRKRRVV